MAAAPVDSGRVYLPLLAAELPSEWTVSESATFASPSGVTIKVELNAAPEGERADELLELRAAEVRARLDNPSEISTSAAAWRGRSTMHSHQFRFERDGAAHVGSVSCVVDDGLVLTALSSWTADDIDAPSQVEAALARLRLLNRPIIEIRGEAEAAERPAPAKRSPVAPETWKNIHAQWRSEQPDAAKPFDATRWSPDELATFATIAGAPMFPTVGTEWLASLPDTALRAVLGSVVRSLTARDITRVLDDGSVALADDLGAIVETAVYPDLSIAIESTVHGTTHSEYIGVRPDTATLVSVLPNGARQCSRLDVADVANYIYNTAGLNSGVPAPSRDERVVTLEDLDDQNSDIDTSIRITTTWRDGEAITGAVMWFAHSTDGVWWLAEPRDETEPVSWTLNPTDPETARDTLLSALPGG